MRIMEQVSRKMAEKLSTQVAGHMADLKYSFKKLVSIDFVGVLTSLYFYKDHLISTQFLCAGRKIFWSHWTTSPERCR